MIIKGLFMQLVNYSKVPNSFRRKQASKDVQYTQNIQVSYLKWRNRAMLQIYNGNVLVYVMIILQLREMIQAV